MKVKMGIHGQSIVLLLALNGLISSSLPLEAKEDAVLPTNYISRTPRMLNWANINKKKEGELRIPTRIHNKSDPNKDNIRRQDFVASKPVPNERSIVSPNIYGSEGSGIRRHDQLNQVRPNNVGVTPKMKPDSFQRRALDFLYHKFVEPKVHKHIEPRPSLIEELIGTFEKHVRKDLHAWNKASSSNSPPRGKEVMEAYPSNIQKQVVPYPGKPISSVAEVHPGETDDTFIVTDDVGVNHMITVDEILQSLAGMNEGEINELLLGSPIEPTVSRMDTNIYDEPSKPMPEINAFVPSIANDIQYSRKGSDDNDVILIKDEHGDTRLVTVRDVKTAEKKKEPAKIEKKPKPVNTNLVNSYANQESLLDKNKVSFITIEDLLQAQNSHFSGNPSGAVQTTYGTSLPLESNPNVKEEETPDPISSIRQSLLEVRKQKPGPHRLSTYPQSSSTSLSSLGASAPNSPPLKVINTDAPLVDFLPSQNTVSIRNNVPPIIQRTGLRNRLSNFFSRLIGKPVTDVSLSNEEDQDQFVQIVMPRSDSNIMEQITIPLPKPIHFRGRKLQSSSPQNSKNIAIDKAQRRSSIQINTPSTFQRKSEQITPNMKLGTSTAELILKTANVPESVREKLLVQMNDKPEFVLPSARNDNNPVNSPPQVASPKNDQIDRIFQIKNKAKKKDILFPTEYVYEIPNPYEHYEQTYFPPPSHHGGKHYKKEYGEDGPPLFDLSLLADLVLLSKFGEDNESFQLPKIGDSSKFVDIRKNYR